MMRSQRPLQHTYLLALLFVVIKLYLRVLLCLMEDLFCLPGLWFSVGAVDFITPRLTKLIVVLHELLLERLLHLPLFF